MLPTASSRPSLACYHHHNNRLVVAPIASSPLSSPRTCTPQRPSTLASRRTAPKCHAANIVADVLGTSIQPAVQDVCVTLLVGIGAYVWVKMFDALAERRVFDQTLSRKLVHLSAGPLFVLSWVLFSPEPYARYLAALVPCMQALRLIAVGTGWLDSPNTVRAVSRSGDRGELLRGPLYYVLIMVVITTLYWRDSPVGVIALALMCGGDGLADIVGRRFGGGNKLPYNASKSLSGSLAMFAGMLQVCGFNECLSTTGGFAMSMGILVLFSGLGFFECDLVQTATAVAVVALVATLTESLPINKDLDDNLSVPGVALLMGMLLVRSGAAV